MTWLSSPCFVFLSTAALSQEEASALEAANVYAILASGPLVEGVLGQLRHTQAILEDLDESLKVSAMQHCLRTVTSLSYSKDRCSVLRHSFSTPATAKLAAARTLRSAFTTVRW
eukprot:GHRR01033308.1.p2 GENE.GHRR01033308.1~~GHRR01033308.1.p2  ORF type:complete len:114 (-),score=13.73 GHRR01033308.1:502-843(-)